MNAERVSYWTYGLGGDGRLWCNAPVTDPDRPAAESPASSPATPPSHSPAVPPAVLIYVRDLLFSSKVVATARAEGVSFKVVRDLSKLMATPAPRLIVDLNSAENLDAAAAWKRQFGGEVIGFAGHVNVDTLAAARAVGIDRVMTNGAFTSALPGIIRESATSA